MTLIAVVQSFFDTDIGKALIAIYALGILDFALGIFASIRDRVFKAEAIDAWLRSQLAGRLLPLTAVLIIGYMLGGLSFDSGDLSSVVNPGTIVTGIGLVGAAAYIYATISSIRESFDKKPETREVPKD